MKNKNRKSLKLKKMKISTIKLLIMLVLTMTSQISIAQKSESNTEFIQKSKDVLTEMIKKAPNLQSYYDNSYGYAVFPKVTKVGISIGGAGGKGIVFKNHLALNKSKLKQFTIGMQFGIQKYSEVLFFQNKEAFEHFMNPKLKFDGQVSAVAPKKGISADLPYSDGVTIFTQSLNGLMFEASIGGQYFSNQPIVMNEFKKI